MNVLTDTSDLVCGQKVVTLTRAEVRAWVVVADLLAEHIISTFIYVWRKK